VRSITNINKLEWYCLFTVCLGLTTMTTRILKDTKIGTTFCLSLSGTELADNLPTSPRLIKTHLPVQLVPKSFWEQNSRVKYMGSFHSAM